MSKTSQPTIHHSSGTSHKYRPEIDGLRAFAVLPVVLFHFGFGLTPGGFLGVDVFFVISGYLITQILCRELSDHEFSFREFWIRRILRIFPALLTMIAATLAAAWWCTPKPVQPACGKQAVAALLSAANMWFWKHASDYWGQAAEQSPLLHTWSLSVEEQFYILLPLILFAAAPLGIRAMRLVTMAITILSLSLFLYGISRYRIESVFYLLPTRAWELGLGCCLALFDSSEPRRGSPPTPRVKAITAFIALLGLAAIAIGCVLPPGRTRAMLCGTFGAAAVLAWGGSGPAHAILVQPLLVTVGRASYSIYLWHWPILALSEFFDLEKKGTVQAVLIAALASLSYVAIEKPTRRNRRILPYVGVGYAVTLGLAFAMAMSSGSYDTSRFTPVTSHASFYDLSIGLPDSEKPSPGVPKPSWIVDANAYETTGIVLGPRATPEIVVFGDSHGLMWCETIRSLAENRGKTTSFWCANATPPFPGTKLLDPRAFTPEQRRRFDEARKTAVARWRPAVVVLCARWSTYREDEAADFVDFLAAHAGHVLLFEQPPENAGNRCSAPEWLCFKNVMPTTGARQYLKAGNTENYNNGRALVRRLAARHSNCVLVPIADLYLDGDTVFLVDDNRVLYVDDDHLSDQGATYAATRIDSVLAEHLR